MTCQQQDNGVNAAVELIAEHGLERMLAAIEMVINEAMRLERRRHLGVDAYERSERGAHRLRQWLQGQDRARAYGHAGTGCAALLDNELTA